MLPGYVELDYLKSRDGLFVEHIGHAMSTPFICYDFFMIAYIAHGDGFFEDKTQQSEVHEGDVFIINPNTNFHFYSSGNRDFLETYCCYFLSEKIARLNKILSVNMPQLEGFFDDTTIHVIKTIDTASKEIRDILVRMIDEFAHCPPGYAELSENYLEIMYTKLLRRYEEALNNPVFHSNTTVDRIIRYINYNLSYGVTVRDIAEANHLSEEYVCRLFKKHTGMTPVTFINQLKVDKVRDMLENTDRSIESIADAMGCQPVYIKRLFKKHTGMSLKDYRNKFHYKK